MMHYKRVLPFFLLILCFGFSACGPNAKDLNTSGIEKLKNEDYEGALEEFTKAVEKDPEFAESYLNRGFVYGNRGELQEALADFNKAIEIDSGYVEAYYNRGFIYGFFEEFDKAMADFDKVLELNPKDAEAYINRALIRSRIGDREGELADLKKAAALGDPTARNWLDDNGVEWEAAEKGSDSAGALDK